MKNKTLYITFAFTLLTVIFIVTPKAEAQNDEGFIYGKITTIDNNIYTGAIRWGKEEVFWFDMFNSSKIRNENLKYLSSDERDKMEDKNREWTSRIGRHIIRGDWHDDHSHTHIFACNFGDIKSLAIVGRERVELTLKNGDVLDLEGGSNDMGEEINVFDSDIGVIELKWGRVEKVEFLSTPNMLTDRFGAPLYGTVSTDQGDYTGFVQWDHDERVSTDKLDGDNEDGDISIEFGKIQSIERDGRGSKVVLKSGRDFYLTGSNDVNSENRGIIVNMPGEGRVDIEWYEFRKVTFTDTPKDSGPAYNQYVEAKNLEGIVKTKTGKTLQGRIIYDLDESYNMEILQGTDDDIKHLIPFRDIKSIQPKNFSYTNVELKSGKKLLLTDSQDVTDENDGILVLDNTSEPVYIAWDDVEEIQFK